MPRSGFFREPAGGQSVAWLVGLGTLLTTVCFYPGYLNGDSSWQYTQGVSGRYNDMHPVVMSWLWGRLDRVIEGSGGLFLLHTLGFFLGLGLVLRAFTSSRRGFAIAAVAIATSIPIFSMLSQIHKDLGMVVGLVMALGLLIAADRHRSLRVLLLALPFLWYAISVRHNGAMAALPFALWIGWLLARDHLPPDASRKLGTPVRRLAIGFVMFLALFSSAWATSRAILGEEGRHMSYGQFLMAYDLVGISVRSGTSQVSELYSPHRPYQMRELRALYDKRTCYPLFWGRHGLRRIPVTYRPEMLSKVFETWRAAIRAEPRAYLAHRMTLFAAHLGIGPGTPARKIEFDHEVGNYKYRGPTVFDWPHARLLVRFFEWTTSTLFFRPWPYLALGALCTVVAWWRRNSHRLEITLLALSSAVYIAPLFVIGVASEFRYMWWPILAAMLQVVALIDGVQAPWVRWRSWAHPMNFAKSLASCARRGPSSRLVSRQVNLSGARRA